MKHSPAKLAQLIGRGFQSRDVTHVLHLTTDSYAAHMALGGYYGGIIDLLDGIAESFQGIHGIVPTALYMRALPCSNEAPETAAAYLREYGKWIEANRADICESSMIQNQIDTVMELIMSTVYKLENLS